ncbi:MAG: hypothetical protein D6798_03395 [Deltaproteobacteria bacterium]|nr:MAG: hypothetical protein D6798_03395 [Deltaproteobacteria bacterium]
MSRTRFSALLAGLVALCTALPAPALAQGKPPPPKPPVSQPVKAKVDMQIRVVYATSSHSRVDPQLSSLTRYLSHLRFTGYELLDTQRAQTALGGKAQFSVVGGRKVTVTLLGRDERKARVRVQVSGARGKQLLDTTMSVNRNGTVIVAGPKYQDGILVLPLTARY